MAMHFLFHTIVRLEQVYATTLSLISNDFKHLQIKLFAMVLTIANLFVTVWTVANKPLLVRSLPIAIWNGLLSFLIERPLLLGYFSYKK